MSEREGEALLGVLQFTIPVFLLLLGFISGRWIDRNHLKRLDLEEARLSSIRLADLKRLPPGMRATEGTMVVGQVVIALDYFKVFTGSIRKLFGGEIRGFTLLVERARREAVVRMLKEARAAGATHVWCVRIESSTVGGSEQGKKPGGVEVLAYGTALRLV